MKRGLMSISHRFSVLTAVLLMTVFSLSAFADCALEDLLHFTAQEANVTVKLNKIKDFNWKLETYNYNPNMADVPLKYSVNGGDWATYTWDSTGEGASINLNNAGDKVYFRAKETLTKFSIDGQNYFTFSFSDSVAAGGSVMSLLGPDSCNATIIPNDNCFARLFQDCSTLTSAPALPATTLAQGCYSSMFSGCTSLTFAPALPATTLVQGCYSSMFYGCTSLTVAPNLPATTLAKYCYYRMFEGCTQLTDVPDTLPAITLFTHCYNNMFSGCTSLTVAPALPATILDYGCYYEMFNGCTFLTSAPTTLPATTLADHCYRSMFSGCTSLTSAPDTLPSTSLSECCYYAMFYGCTSLEESPFLPQPESFVDGAYQRMFEGCSGLKKVTTSFGVGMDWKVGTGTTYDVGKSNTYLWLSGVAEDGTFIGAPGSVGPSPSVRGNSTIPKTWTYEAKETEDTDSVFLHFTAQEANVTVRLDKRTKYDVVNNPAYNPQMEDVSLTYSMDGVSWTTYHWESTGEGVPIILKNVGDKVYFKAGEDLLTRFSLDMTRFFRFSFSGSVAGGGSVMSLLCEKDTMTAIPSSWCFYGLFENCSALTTAPALRATTLASNCYEAMFSNCTSLTIAPALPATTLASNCYEAMFSNCTSLTSAPALSATVLESGCYESMFRGCTSLTSAPALPATILASSCYRYMFYNCVSLTSAPDLSATDLAPRCYEAMFYNCVSLKSAPVLPATTLASECYYNMFSDCTSLTSTPDTLPATTLADNCYYGMFSYCTSLTASPFLPQPASFEGVHNAYAYMFTGCSSLNLVTTSFNVGADWEVGNNTDGWLKNVAKYGTFIGAPGSVLPTERGGNTVPEKWNNNTDMDNLLHFTAQEANVTVKLNKNTPAASNVSLEYSTDGSTWTDYTWDASTGEGAAVNLNNTGDKVYFRAKTALTTFNTSSKIFSFSFSGSVAAGGRVMSLLCPDGKRTDIPSSYCFYKLFYNCSTLTSAPELPATTLKYACYSNMFHGCSSLSSAPELPSTELADRCYYYMFCNCTSLVSAPELPATELKTMCYYCMFRGCVSLTAAPALPASTLADMCYYCMFYDCTSLVSTPELPATELKNACYYCMFNGCVSLTVAPELPATVLADQCYYFMFKGCSSLTKAPTELPATDLTHKCYSNMFKNCTSLTTSPSLPQPTSVLDLDSAYYRMFYGCSSLNKVRTSFDGASWSMGANTGEWLYKVATTGIFIGAPGSTAPSKRNANTVPNDWSYVAETDNDLDNLLHFTAQKNNVTISLDKRDDSFNFNPNLSDVPLEYSVNGGAWTTYTWESTGEGASINLNNAGDKVCFRAKETLTKFSVSYNKFFNFSFSGSVAGEGSVMSLLCPAGEVTAIPSKYCFFRLFYNCTSLTSAPALPATTLADCCYDGMFHNCTSLASIPDKLPATKLKYYCYSGMFEGCTSLTSAPALPATNLAEWCYSDMFSGCTSLTSAPALPATTLAGSCYRNMFSDCTSLIEAPALPATTLASNCYYSMFRGCTSLTSAPALPATTLTGSCYSYMFYGCTSLTSAPDTLPATTLTDWCYTSMFEDCKSLTTSPFLPQPESFVAGAYRDMFNGCSKLNLVRTSFKISMDWCLEEYFSWLYHVAGYGTFICAPGSVARPRIHGACGIPAGWICVPDSTPAYRSKSLLAQTNGDESDTTTDLPDTTTELSATPNDNTAPEPFKIIENGRVVIIKNGIKYDMSGKVIR